MRSVNKKILILFMLLFALLLSGCAGKEDVVEETEAYKITRVAASGGTGWEYRYCLFDCDHRIVREETNVRCPHISVGDDGLVMVTVQAGTGIGTQWGYFYDRNTDTFSKVFYSIFDVCGGRVAHGEGGKVVVRDIFDDKGYYTELSDFPLGLSATADPVTGACFEANGQRITVFYLTGEDARKVSQTFDLH